jgi:hypothetical protein
LTYTIGKSSSRASQIAIALSVASIA